MHPFVCLLECGRERCLNPQITACVGGGKGSIKAGACMNDQSMNDQK